MKTIGEKISKKFVVCWTMVTIFHSNCQFECNLIVACLAFFPIYSSYALCILISDHCGLAMSSNLLLASERDTIRGVQILTFNYS